MCPVREGFGVCVWVVVLVFFITHFVRAEVIPFMLSLDRQQPSQQQAPKLLGDVKEV